MCASHKPPRCRERDVPCPLCDKNAKCMYDVSVCVPHAGRPSTAKHSLRTRRRNPSSRRMAIRRRMRACAPARACAWPEGPCVVVCASALRAPKKYARGAPQRKKRKQGRRRTKDATVRHKARVAPRETGRRRRRCTQGGSNGAPQAAVRVPEPHFVLFARECRWWALRSAHTVARQPSSRKL